MRCRLLLFLMISAIGFSQDKPLLYNVDDLPQSLMLNPGVEIDLEGHIGLPFLSQIQLSVGSSGFSAYDIFNRKGDLNSRITRTIDQLRPYDHVKLNQQLEIISLGWRLDHRNYLSTGIYQELDLFSYLPRDLLRLAHQGNRNYIDRSFDFSQLAFTAEILTVYHLGWNHKLNNRWTIGGRGKIYAGVFNAENTGSRGTFATMATPGGANIYRHVVRDLDVNINTSGFSSLEQEEGMSIEEATADLMGRSLLGGNLGLGIDLGMTYFFSDQLQATASILDIGLLYQRNDVKNYRYFGSFETDGLNPLSLGGGAGPEENWEGFEQDLRGNLQDQRSEEPYFTWRPQKINLGLEYAFGLIRGPCHYLRDSKDRRLNRLGIILAGIRRPRHLRGGFTAYWDRRISALHRFRVAYSLNDYSLSSIGLMYSATFNKFNVYIAGNNLLALTDIARARNFSLQLGFQLLFHER